MKNVDYNDTFHIFRSIYKSHCNCFGKSLQMSDYFPFAQILLCLSLVSTNSSQFRSNHPRCSVKMMFFKISYSQQNTYARVSFSLSMHVHFKGFNCLAKIKSSHFSENQLFYMHFFRILLKFLFQ